MDIVSWCIHAIAFETQFHDVSRIITVENRKVGFKPNLAGMVTQESSRDRVKCT